MIKYNKYNTMAQNEMEYDVNVVTVVSMNCDGVCRLQCCL